MANSIYNIKSVGLNVIPTLFVGHYANIQINILFQEPNRPIEINLELQYDRARQAKYKYCLSHKRANIWTLLCDS